MNHYYLLNLVCNKMNRIIIMRHHQKDFKSNAFCAQTLKIHQPNLLVTILKKITFTIPQK